MVFSLRLKIALLVSGVIGVFAAVMAFSNYRSIREREQETEAHAVVVSKMIAQVPVAEQLHGGHAEELLQTLLPVVRALDRNVVFVVFTDGSGRVLARHVAPAEEGGPAFEDLRRLASATYQGSPDWKLVNVTIENRSGQVLQRLRVGYSLAETRRKVARDMSELALLTGLLTALGLTAAVLLAVRLTRPLEKLAGAMRRVQYGELGPTVEVETRDEIAGLARAFNEMSIELKSRERLRMNFARFVSSAVADKVIAENRTVRLSGERRIVTVLFADIRGFTTIAANQSPEQVVSMLNEFFRTLVDVIPRYGGTLDKFIGDAFMAVFNAPSDLPVHEVSGVMSGLEMQRVMRHLNEKRRERGEQELGLGIGVNTGEVVAGTFGSERRLEYTVIGAAVNLAQRIEDYAQGGELLVSESTYQAVRHLVEAEPLGPVALKGLDAPVPLYKVVSLQPAVFGPETPVEAAKEAS